MSTRTTRGTPVQSGEPDMSLNEHQKRTLLTNLARDKAENLRNEIRRVQREAQERDHSHLSPEQRAMGEHALNKALESAERLLANLETAMRLSEQITQDAAAEADGDNDSDGEASGRPELN